MGVYGIEPVCPTTLFDCGKKADLPWSSIPSLSPQFEANLTAVRLCVLA